MIDQFSKNSTLSEEDDLDLYAVLRLFKRNKNLILKFGIIFFIASILYSLTQKRVWQGQFEIVIEDVKKMDSRSSILNQLSQSNLFAGGKQNDLLTEAGILQSQSILMPIFNFTNEYNSDLNKKNKIPTFAKWSKNLDVLLKKNTSILKISYKDKNKERIIPVLEKISSTYQSYSGYRKKRALELSKTYLSNQIENYRGKAKASKKIAFNFAIENNLNMNDLQSNSNYTTTSSLNDALTAFGNVKFGNLEGSDADAGSLEAIRVKLKNEINEIDFQIKKIEDLNNIEDLQYIGATMKPLIEQGLPQTLEKIETELIQLRSKYTEKDESIKNMLETRDLYTRLLKERAIGYLKAKKISYESKLESVERPKGIIVKGKELMREANRDENTLVELENNLRNVELLQARLEDPWKLITKPTLNNTPVYPNRKNISGIGLLLGLLIGSIYAYGKEKNAGLILEENALEKSFSLPIIKRLNSNQAQISSIAKELKFKELEELTKNKIKLIFLANDSESELKKRFEGLFLSSSREKYDLIYSVENLIDINPEDFYILVTSLGKVSFADVKDFKNRINLLNINLKGIFIF